MEFSSAFNFGSEEVTKEEIEERSRVIREGLRDHLKANLEEPIDPEWWVWWCWLHPWEWRVLYGVSAALNYAEILPSEGSLQLDMFAALKRLVGEHGYDPVALVVNSAGELYALQVDPPVRANYRWWLMCRMGLHPDYRHHTAFTLRWLDEVGLPRGGEHLEEILREFQAYTEDRLKSQRELFRQTMTGERLDFMEQVKNDRKEALVAAGVFKEHDIN